MDIKIKENLKKIFGFNQFRGNQEAIVDNILQGNNTFVIMPTGAGKSLCYQLPAVTKEGTAIVISPLIALMKNQVDQLNAFGINAHFLNSTLSKTETNKVKKEVLSGATKLLYVAPESLTKEENVEFLKSAQLSFVAIDEAHCISEWGHDFNGFDIHGFFQVQFHIDRIMIGFRYPVGTNFFIIDLTDIKFPDLLLHVTSFTLVHYIEIHVDFRGVGRYRFIIG